jgi:hypothetical protein
MVSLPGSDAVTTGIAVSGNSVYVSGTLNALGNAEAAYWKDGLPIAFPTGAHYSNASGIAVVGNDVYVSGNILFYLSVAPVYWKNAVQTTLTDTSFTGSIITAASSGIVVDAGNVYVSGVGQFLAAATIFPGLNSPIYWKNGKLGDPYGFQ